MSRNTNPLVAFISALMLISPLLLIGQEAEYQLSTEISDTHVPLVSSALHIDTAETNFRPLANMNGGEWINPKSDASFASLAFEISETPGEELSGIINMLDGNLALGTPLPIKSPADWDTKLVVVPDEATATNAYYLRAAKDRTCVYVSFYTLTTQEFKTLFNSFSLLNTPTSEDPFAQLPLSLKLPADFPLQYAGKVPMLGFAFQGEGETMIGLDDGAMMSQLLDLEEEIIRSQVGEEAIVKINGEDKLIFGYEQIGEKFRVFGIRGIGGQSVAMMGEGKHSETMEATLLSLLEALEQ